MNELELYLLGEVFNGHHQVVHDGIPMSSSLILMMMGAEAWWRRVEQGLPRNCGCLEGA